ncbi:16S rRNA (adenine(1518)-N(6)/adenine(1519)-N(6))-dimethyltransferase RsmA [Ammonifex thiophilus]|uniref:Ribosomal RNA small subunit methyltransferase A n=1 Tax=Ammonifex thiophilus TaxID=444093 RepID=A0A3D8P5M0_9THEO|nr:16S rRNA (adenine(1518)-N(6)/adenine(1519)-N(6))-dimethyltransferase RsmA [Ammonifex thiophilus]RDV84614.1 16S rRNA (adenine(1518)-N(6)/adenine(1519)-N(6))-dimethyltransferase RsmA [Ammonifex thiophilus]
MAEKEEELLSPAAVKAALAEWGIKPRKRWGQHFLVRREVLAKITEAAELSPADTVVEVGPGLGALTARLLEEAGRVVAIELDPRLEAFLRARLGGHPRLTLIRGDALKCDFDLLVREAGGSYPYKVVANLPYYLTSPLLLRLLTSSWHISLMVLMLQREVALRLLASPGTKEYGSLSLLVQYYTSPSLVTFVPRHSFYPPPEVDSAVVRLEVRAHPPVEVGDESIFFGVIRAAFAKRRKTLLNALASSSLGLSKEDWQRLLAEVGVDPGRRGETLSLEEFARIARRLQSNSTCGEKP